VSHEGAVLDVLVIADHVHRVVAGLRGPVADVTRAVALIVTLDLGLRGALDGEACQEGVTLLIPLGSIAADQYSLQTFI